MAELWFLALSSWLYLLKLSKKNYLFGHETVVKTIVLVLAKFKQRQRKEEFTIV